MCYLYHCIDKAYQNTGNKPIYDSSVTQLIVRLLVLHVLTLMLGNNAVVIVTLLFCCYHCQSEVL